MCIYIHNYVYMNISIYSYIHMHLYMNTYIYIYINIYTFTYTYTEQKIQLYILNTYTCINIYIGLVIKDDIETMTLAPTTVSQNHENSANTVSSVVRLSDPDGFLLSNDIISSVFVELTC
jgi:hypothetical protein